MQETRVPSLLFSFVGSHEPIQDPVGDPGPVLSLLRHRPFDHVVLFVTSDDYKERAITVKRVADAEGLVRTFSFVDLVLESVVNYEEIFTRLHQAVRDVLASLPHDRYRKSILLDPGTPQMQTVWFLLVKAELIDAKLLQGTPARFSGGRYRCREVSIDPGRVPLHLSYGTVPTSTARSAPPPTECKILFQADEQLTDDSAGPPPATTRWRSQSPPMAGHSAVFEALITSATQVARFRKNVLISGETGSGKELVARLIHNRSDRASGPFIAVNCAAISETLAESELFGHRKGAYSGASGDRDGRFRAAHGGTLFLDEVGELRPEMQSKLLRVLEDHVVTPLGSDQEITVDVRVIAATNGNLLEAIGDGRFREDLYERLQTLTINVPPLRERVEDIPDLARFFLDKENSENGSHKEYSPAAMEALSGFRWPRNVRQLANTVAKLYVHSADDIITLDLVESVLGSGDFGTDEPDATGAGDGAAGDDAAGETAGTPVYLPPDGVDLPALLTRMERSYYVAALEAAEGNRAEAAGLLGVNAPAFRKALRGRFADVNGRFAKK